MLSVNYIKEEQNYYEQKIKELIEKDEYNIRRNQRQQKEIERLNNIINKIEDIVLCYGGGLFYEGTFNIEIYQEMQQNILEAIEESKEGKNEKL